MFPTGCRSFGICRTALQRCPSISVKTYHRYRRYSLIVDQIKVLEEKTELAQDIEVIEQAMHDFRLQSHAEQWEAFKNITALIEEVRHCWTRTDYRRVQQHLGKHIDRVDAAAENAHQRFEKADDRLRRLRRRKVSLDPSEVASLEADHKQAAFDNELYLRLGRQYRMVGDALAWQFYNFQALPIHALGMNQSPGPNTSFKKVGTDVEMEAIEKLWNEHGAFALHHDYTNCLRVWDLSILYPDFSREIVEIKVEGGNITPRQWKKGERAVTLINHNECITPEGHSLLHRAHSPQLSDKVVRTNLVLLQDAIVEALEEGIGYAAHEYLAVAVMYMKKIAATPSSDQVMNDRLNQALDRLPDTWMPFCTDCIQGNSYQKNAQLGLSVPYTIYPLPSDYASALVTTYLRAHFRLNTAAITQAFREAGFEAECLLGKWRVQGIPEPKKVKSPYFLLRRGEMKIAIHDLAIEQMLFEGLPLEDFVTSVVADYETLMSQKDLMTSTSPFGNPQRLYTLTTYKSLEDVWRASREFVLPSTMEAINNADHE